MQVAIELFATIVQEAFPIALVFAMGTRLCDSFIRMAFEGRIRL